MCLNKICKLKYVDLKTILTLILNDYIPFEIWFELGTANGNSETFLFKILVQDFCSGQGKLGTIFEW